MPPTRQRLVPGSVPTPVFLILLALADGDAHGYQIRKDLIARSNGAVKLDPGSLYRLIARMLDEGLIAEAPDDDGGGGDDRRRDYRLTAQGRRLLSDETEHLANLVAAARASSRRRIRQS